MKKHLLSALFVGLTALCMGATAYAQRTQDWVLFYDPTTAAAFAAKGETYAEIGQIAFDGQYRRIQYATLFDRWTHMVKMDYDIVFAYNSGTGDMIFYKITEDGRFNSGPKVRISAGWTQIVKVDNHLLFFNDWNRALAVAHLQRDGNNAVLSTTQSSIAPTRWTHIVPVGKNVLLYNKDNGCASMGHINRDGLYIETQLSYFTTGWSNIVSTANGSDILFYNSVNGLYAIGHLDHSGQFHQTQSGLFSSGWSDIVATSHDLLLYNRTSGLAVMGHITFEGLFNQTHVTDFDPGWPFIVSTENWIVFHSPSRRVGAVGYIDRAGLFNQTQTLPVSAFPYYNYGQVIPVSKER